jgi:hypothetical protein
LPPLPASECCAPKYNDSGHNGIAFDEANFVAGVALPADGGALVRIN